MLFFVFGLSYICYYCEIRMILTFMYQHINNIKYQKELFKYYLFFLKKKYFLKPIPLIQSHVYSLISLL